MELNRLHSRKKQFFNPPYALENLLQVEIAAKPNVSLHFQI
ncbi:MAG: hypothetical protein ACI9Y7_001495 [Dokdonia sp.]|jgi:hypothetical protein